jgi:hypothetical protein
LPVSFSANSAYGRTLWWQLYFTFSLSICEAAALQHWNIVCIFDHVVVSHIVDMLDLSVAYQLIWEVTDKSVDTMSLIWF